MPDIPTRTKREKELTAALLLALGAWDTRVARHPLGVDWPAFGRELELAAVEPLAKAYEDSVEVIAAELVFPVDPGEWAAEAHGWAQSQAAVLAAQMQTATQGGVRDAVEQAARDGTALTVALAPLFGVARAEGAAIGEVTRAVSVSQEAVVRRFDLVTGEETTSTWFTRKDDRVCPICRPLHTQPESVFAFEFPNGPPAHPRCRCRLKYKTTSQFAPSALLAG